MTTQANTLVELDHYFESKRDAIFEDYFTFLRFQSISSEVDFQPEMQKCLDWLDKYLSDAGMETEQWATSGHPTLFASWLEAGADKPTILLYGHYDVQPVDPLDEWESDPFEPRVDGQEVFARGASDNKGQCFYVVQALKALLQRDGSLPVNVKLVIEGEEEVGSEGLGSLLREKQQELSADVLAVVDLGLTAPDKPAVTLGLRGMCSMDVTVQGTSFDLHSGCHGGMAYNPLHALAEMIASLHDRDGRVTVPGFYDGVEEMTEEQLAKIDFSFDEEEYITMFGSRPTGGEKAYSPLERQWIRPTVEVNGMWGGYNGDGFKTVIPAKAFAKISCRTVTGQDPKHVIELVAKTLEERAPDGITVTTHIHEGVGSAVRGSTDSKGTRAFQAAYGEVLGKPCLSIMTGGSVPIVTELAEASGGDVVMMGYALEDDQIHAPNEHFGLDRFKNGFLTIARALEILGARQD